MKILIVEDSLNLRESLIKGLRHAGFAVDGAADGVEGSWRIENNPYDAIVLDLMLPGIDGLEVLRRMRAKRIATPVLILTAKDAVQDRVRGLDEGADDYLVKPFAFEELLARLRSLSRRALGAERNQLELGTLRVDLAARVASVADKRLELTRREYMLLEYFASHRGHVVSRADVEEHLYDDRHELVSNVVDATVARLRRKLEAHGGSGWIRTQRGMGYVFDPVAT